MTGVILPGRKAVEAGLVVTFDPPQSREAHRHRPGLTPSELERGW